MVFIKPFNLLNYVINDSSSSSSSTISSSSSSSSSLSSLLSAKVVRTAAETFLSSIENINNKDNDSLITKNLSSSVIQDTPISMSSSSFSETLSTTSLPTTVSSLSSTFSDSMWLSSAIYNIGLSSLNVSSSSLSSSSLSLPLISNISISSSSIASNLFNSNDVMNSNQNNGTTLYMNNYNINDYYNSDDIFELSPCDPNNIAFNCSIDEFLLYARGPQQLPLGTALLVTILFVGIFVTGVVGNVIVCIVIVRHSTMHTATNYYLFSLAVSDLIFLMMGLPYEISLYWHQYPYNLGLPFCKIRALISEASTYVSVLTIVAFSMERFLAICHPLHLYTMSGFKRALRIIAALWVISFLSAVPFAIFTKIDFLKYPVDNSTIYKSAFCAMLENPPGFPLWELSSCLFFVIPMVLIMVLYGRMGCQIRSRTRHSVALGVQQGSMHKESRHQQSRKAIIRMLAAVVITFFVCWAPFHAQRLMYLYARDWAYFQDINTWLFSVAGWFYYVSCTINPILYNVMSHRYRVAFKETLCGRRRGYYQNNGFARDQSSFRETTINSSTGYENSHLVRIRSMRNSHYIKNRDPSIKSGMLWRSNTICSKPIMKEDDTKLKINQNNSTNVVVVVDNNTSINSRTKIFTENNAQENLLKKDETYI